MSPYRRVIEVFKKILRPRSASANTPASPALHPSSALDVAEHPPRTPLVIPRAQHSLSRNQISKNALRVLYRLKESGYQAYLVGGGVRDLLLGRQPKDFDVATNAKPEEIKEIFRNCRLIGRRFRLAHVHFGDEIIEVATFRAHHAGSEDGEGVIEDDGRIVRDNVYGTFEQDAWRRDLTINALYYNISDFSVVDYTHQGMADLKAGLVRLIGDPIQRYREDPVRMLRAARFAAKLDLRLHPATEEPLRDMAALLENIPPARLHEEVIKLFMSGYGFKSFEKLRHYGLFALLFPQTERSFADPKAQRLLELALRNTDERVARNKPVTPAFLFAALLWQPVLRLAQDQPEDNEIEMIHRAGHQAMREQAKTVAVHKRFALVIYEIWENQPRLIGAVHQRRALRLLNQQRFRAAYDFLLLRAAADPDLQDAAAWWTQLVEADPAQREVLFQPAGPKRKKRKPRKKRRPDEATQESPPPEAGESPGD